jgi:prepilin-type processing-associated H-X9-DG protein
LIDAIVVMAVIVLLLALILPAIQQARESARRQQCQNNLKQLGLGLHNYHDVHRVFPPGFVLGQDGIYHGWGWNVTVLPYVDAWPLANYFPFDRGLQKSYQQANLNPDIPMYRCPANAGSTHVGHASVVTTDVKDWQVTPGTVDATSVFSRTNYFGIAGYLQSDYGGIKPEASGEPPLNEPLVNKASLGRFGSNPSPEHSYCDQKLFQGVFGQNSNVSIRDVRDGTANTLFVGERYSPARDGLIAVGHGTWIGVPDCTSAAGLAMALGDTSVKLNAGARNRAETTGFGSVHRDGAHFLYVDGRVRFLTDSIDIKVYRVLSTIDDGAPTYHVE